MKPGTKLKSAVCDTEVMVIKGGGDDVVECGGAPMKEAAAADRADLDPDFAEGTKMGKRYTDAAATIELLCIKPGKGSLSLNGTPLQLKDAKPLPSSD